MLYLLLAIICSTAIFVCFKYIEKFKINLLAAITINYVTASICGTIIGPKQIDILTIISAPWFSFSLLIGVLFIVMFFIIGLSSQKAGIAITTLAAKMSFIIPMLFSLLFYNEGVSVLKILGIVMAVIAVILGVYTKKDPLSKTHKIWLPLILFLGAGIVDSLVKFAQESYLSSSEYGLFSSALFGIAAISGLLIQLIKGSGLSLMIKPKVLLGGTILGVVNFGSLYYLIATLDQSGLDSSVVFTIINMSIVSLSLILGMSLFREKISFIQATGIVMALIAILILL